jgi:hypothetical protein
MVMTMSLLVYATLEYRISQTLAEYEESVPDQKGKPTRRPTAKWVFELFMDGHLLTTTTEKTIRTFVLNLREELGRLLELMVATYMELYSCNAPRREVVCWRCSSASLRVEMNSSGFLTPSLANSMASCSSFGCRVAAE